MISTIESRAANLMDKGLLANQDSLVNELLKQGVFSYDDIRNSYDDNDEPQEIFSWYLVDSWTVEQLESIGEPVLINDYGNWWGRTCYGQLVLSDGTFQKIVKKLDEVSL